jgi:hypothetical protein
LRIRITGSHDDCTAAATKVAELLALEVGPVLLASRRGAGLYRVDLVISSAQRSRTRLLGRVTPGYGGCWIYTGTTDRGGYGQFDFDGSKGAHRSAYKILVGPIPDDYDLDHLCHTRDVTCPGGKCIHRRCVNPSHLEPVPHSEHGKRRRRKSHCPSGHPYAGANLVLQPPRSPGGLEIWACRICLSERRRQRRETSW